MVGVTHPTSAHNDIEPKIPSCAAPSHFESRSLHSGSRSVLHFQDAVIKGLGWPGPPSSILPLAPLGGHVT